MAPDPGHANENRRPFLPRRTSNRWLRNRCHLAPRPSHRWLRMPTRKQAEWVLRNRLAGRVFVPLIKNASFTLWRMPAYSHEHGILGIAGPSIFWLTPSHHTVYPELDWSVPQPYLSLKMSCAASSITARCLGFTPSSLRRADVLRGRGTRRRAYPPSSRQRDQAPTRPWCRKCFRHGCLCALQGVAIERRQNTERTERLFVWHA
jgi:hypothetical protein